jgi:peptidoglycan-associated lipoprotein
MIKNSGMMMLAAASLAVLAGCASPVKLDKPVEVEKRDVTTSQTTTSNGQGQSSVVTTDLSGQSNAGATLDRVIYFDFDSYVVKDEFRPIVESHAKMLKANPSAKEVAEGHTDERGGSEYNLALGQKRAEAVVQQLKTLGVGDSQLEAVSYGKERPAVDGHDEAAWAKNRRVELRSK